MDGTRLPPGAAAPPADAAEPAAAELAELTVPPTDLSKAAKQFWRAAAPEAIAQRTLVRSTLTGFRELCQQWAMKEAIAKDIDKVGAASRSADGSLRHYTRLSQRVDASLARFKLTAFGKAAEGVDRQGRPAPATSPWAQVVLK